ncbi:MAG TPA: helix-turn-helix transcriptional regulator [Solirubrobacteraceae bacterium]|jgi:transcriptional regulator with XRE-family HTH domain|nr:helix-turn-helix transcriptional regulator [Solirubrobacteraceae bacterium]
MARTAQPDPILAEVLRRFRENKGLTREAAAFHSGVTVGSIARIELGESAPAFATVRTIARALGVTLVELAVALEAAEGTPDAT